VRRVLLRDKRDSAADETVVRSANWIKLKNPERACGETGSRRGLGQRAVVMTEITPSANS
jgi:hypothetical protein